MPLYRFSLADDGLAPPDILIRRSAVLLYVVGVITSQVAAHIGAIPVSNLRLFEFLGVIALIASLVTWKATESGVRERTLVLTSLMGTAVIAVAVGLTGGNASPLWIYYTFPVIFNAFYLTARTGWIMLTIIGLASALPAIVAGRFDPIALQVLVIAPVYVALTLCAQAMVRGLRQVSRIQVHAANAEARLAAARRWSGQLESLHSLSQEITRLSTVNDIALAIIKHTRRAIDYDTARVYIRQHTSMVPIAYHGSGAYAFETSEALAVEIGEGVTGWVAEHGIAAYIPDLHANPRALPVPGSSLTDESMLLAPMLDDGAVTGVIVLARLGKDRFSHQDLHLLEILAGQAAIAMTRARNLDEVQHLARTDSLTGLLNYRAVSERLALEIVRAEALDQPLSIAVLDADRFKRINDEHGHLAGNDVLCHLGALLSSCCRPSHIAARHGGDEFMLVMPDCRRDDATQVVTNLVEEISSHAIPLGEDHRDAAQVRFSFGIATFPADGDTADQLQRIADLRLYAAKTRIDSGSSRAAGNPDQRHASPMTHDRNARRHTATSPSP